MQQSTTPGHAPQAHHFTPPSRRLSGHAVHQQLVDQVRSDADQRDARQAAAKQFEAGERRGNALGVAKGIAIGAVFGLPAGVVLAVIAGPTIAGWLA